MTKTRTFGSIMADYGGVGPGFDFIRLALSLSIVGFHSFQLTRGNDWMNAHLHGPLDIVATTIVPAFFALSGFLVAGSMARLNNVRVFLIFRGLRIFPRSPPKSHCPH
jgi:peptidoglycan/LPS O-acetylase OafA/YrhL